MAYGLPPNDPRFLAMDEDAMLYDLLLRKYHAGQIERAADPEAAAMADKVASGELDEELARAQLEARRDPSLQRFLRALRGGGRTEVKQPLTIQLRSKT